MSAIRIERFAEIALLVVLVLPVARIAVNGGIRRRFAAFPRIQAVVIISLVVYSVGVAAIALFAPVLLRPAAIAAVAFLIFERWQARHSHGVRSGLPPGSLAFLPIEPWRDPQYYMKEADRHGPVFKFRHFVHPAIGIVGLEQAGDFLRANDASLGVPPAPFSRLVPGGFIRYMEGAEHLDVAATLRSAFTPAAVEACDPGFESEATSAVECLSADGSPDPSPIIEGMLLRQLMFCFFGLKPGPALDRIAGLYDIADYRRLARTGRRKASEAIFEVVQELRAIVARPVPNGSTRPSFLSELASSNPHAIASDGMMCNFAYTFHIARLDVHGLLMWLLVTTLRNGEWLDRLAYEMSEDRAAALRTGGLADRMVRETLRLHQSEFLLRRVQRPISWNGFRIPAGWVVRICVQESHRSSELFENPDVFDPDRFLQPPNRTRYSPFGMAPRLCPGEHLSRAVGRHLVAALTVTPRLKVHSVEPLEFSGFHWRPGPNLRVTRGASG